MAPAQRPSPSAAYRTLSRTSPTPRRRRPGRCTPWQCHIQSRTGRSAISRRRTHNNLRPQFPLAAAAGNLAKRVRPHRGVDQRREIRRTRCSVLRLAHGLDAEVRRTRAQPLLEAHASGGGPPSPSCSPWPPLGTWCTGHARLRAADGFGGARRHARRLRGSHWDGDTQHGVARSRVDGDRPAVASTTMRGAVCAGAARDDRCSLEALVRSVNATQRTDR